MVEHTHTPYTNTPHTHNHTHMSILVLKGFLKNCFKIDNKKFNIAKKWNLKPNP